MNPPRRKRHSPYLLRLQLRKQREKKHSSPLPAEITALKTELFTNHGPLRKQPAATKSMETQFLSPCLPRQIGGVRRSRVGVKIPRQNKKIRARQPKYEQPRTTYFQSVFRNYFTITFVTFAPVRTR